MDYSHRAPIALHLRWLDKRWNCATFLWNPGKSLTILNGCSLFLIPLRFESCLTLFCGKISAVYCKVACFHAYIKDVTLNRQGEHFMFWSIWGLLSMSFLHAGIRVSLGWRVTLHPDRTGTDARAWWGCWGGWWPPICPPNLAAFVLMLVTCRGTLPEGGTPDPLTYVPGCVEPHQYHPKGASIARCVGADTSGLAGSWEKFSCRRVEQSLLRLIPYAGNPRGAHLCVFPKLGFELCMGPSFLLACMLSRRALAGAWWHHPSNAWAEWRQRHSQMLSVTSLRDEAQLFLEGRVSHCKGKSSSAPCPHCPWTSLILFLVQCYRGKW